MGFALSSKANEIDLVCCPVEHVSQHQVSWNICWQGNNADGHTKNTTATDALRYFWRFWQPNVFLCVLTFRDVVAIFVSIKTRGGSLYLSSFNFTFVNVHTEWGHFYSEQRIQAKHYSNISPTGWWGQARGRGPLTSSPNDFLLPGSHNQPSVMDIYEHNTLH